jgi:signal peptidase II
VLAAVAAFVLAADIISKAIVVAHLRPEQPVHLLGNVFELWLTRNPGAAFSVGTGETFIFTAIALAVVIYIARTARKLYSVGWAVALGLLLGGAIGNLGDRIFRSPGLFRGYVVDWIEIPHWPVFNLADSAIVCGGVLAVLLSARGSRLDGTRPGPGGGSDPGGGGQDPEDGPPGPGGRSEPAPASGQSLSGRNGSVPGSADEAGADPGIRAAPREQADAPGPAPLSAGRLQAPASQPVGEPSGGGG